MMSASCYLIVGLGNPGSTYEKTRHNAGFLACDYYADQRGGIFSSTKWQGVYGQVSHQGSKVILLKPQTFMNKSGECVRRFVDYFRIEQTNILILHDDLDIHAGRIKVVARGGAGGHNGIRSLIEHLGSSDFARLKIGIGRPVLNEDGKGIPVDRFVLAPFAKDELAEFNEGLDRIVNAVDVFIEEGVALCMNRINQR